MGSGHAIPSLIILILSLIHKTTANVETRPCENFKNRDVTSCVPCHTIWTNCMVDFYKINITFVYYKIHSKRLRLSYTLNTRDNAEYGFLVETPICMGKHSRYRKVKGVGKKVKDEWIIYLGSRDVPENTKELTLTLSNKYRYKNGTTIYGEVPIVDKTGHKNMDLLVMPIDAERFAQPRDLYLKQNY